jgi:hypothetical protein
VTDLDRYLTERLRSRADDVHVPPGDLPGVVKRGRRRRHHRMVAMTATVAAAAATTVGVGLTRGSAGRQTQVGLRPSGNTTTGAVHRGATGLHWQRSDSRSPLGYASSLTSGGSLYALSTAPGHAKADGAADPALYRSANGVEWALAESPANLYLADLSTSGDRLYGVGTGVATASVAANHGMAPATVGWSDDQTSTWHQTALPLDTASIEAKTLPDRGRTLKIAAGPHGVVASVVFSVTLDLPKLLPAGVTAPNGWAATDAGVDLLGPGSPCPAGTASLPPQVKVPPRLAVGPSGQVSPLRCFTTDGTAVSVSPQAGRGVVRSFTWAELGITGDVLRAVRSEPFVFFAKDGTTFSRVPFDAPTATGMTQLSADNSGFTLLTSGMAPDSKDSKQLQTRVFRSQDGQTWHLSSTLPADVTSVSAVGSLGGQPALVAQSTAGPKLAILGPNGSWTESSLATLFDPAGLTNSRVDVQGAAFGALGVTVVTAVTPDVRDKPVAPATAGGPGPKTQRFQLLFSRDGVTWSNQELRTLVSDAVSVPDVTMTAGQAQVTVQLPTPAGGPSPETMVVGSPG